EIDDWHLTFFGSEVGNMVDATRKLATAGWINLLPAFTLAIEFCPNVTAAAVEPTRDLTARDTCRASERDEAVGEIPTLAELLVDTLERPPARAGLAGVFQIPSGRQPFENRHHFGVVC